MSIKHTIAIANDHAGVALKQTIMQHFQDAQTGWLNLGTNSEESVDYPDHARALCEAILSGEADRGVLICGSGIGMSIAANRYHDIRAALCLDAEMARLSRAHNDANVLVLGARLTHESQAQEIVTAFLTTEFEAGRHERRVNKMTQLSRKS